MMFCKKTFMLSLVFLAVLSFCFISVSAKSIENHWSYADYTSLKNKGLIDYEGDLDAPMPSGYFRNLFLSVALTPQVGFLNGGLFEDDRLIFRKDAVSIITTDLGLEKTIQIDSSDKSQLAESVAKYAYFAGLIKGNEDGELKPDNYLLYGEGYAIINRIIKNIPQISDTNDVDKTDHAYNYTKYGFYERRFLYNGDCDFWIVDEHPKQQKVILSYSPTIFVLSSSSWDGNLYYFNVELPEDENWRASGEIEWKIDEKTYNKLIENHMLKILDSSWTLYSTRGLYGLRGLVSYVYNNSELNKLQIYEAIFLTRKQADEFVPPNWLGEEITDNEEYLDVNLAQYGLPVSQGIKQ